MPFLKKETATKLFTKFTLTLLFFLRNLNHTSYFNLKTWVVFRNLCLPPSTNNMTPPSKLSNTGEYQQSDVMDSVVLAQGIRS